jgi:hypothetical protein
VEVERGMASKDSDWPHMGSGDINSGLGESRCDIRSARTKREAGTRRKDEGKSELRREAMWGLKRICALAIQP